MESFLTGRLQGDLAALGRARQHREPRDFVSGFLAEDGIMGRPVEIAQDKQGRFYITDDLAGRVYRVHYSAEDQ